MARQGSTPVQFSKTTRMDQNICMTSGRAGKVVPVTYVPVLRGDSLAGRVGIDVSLAEMPRPLLNAVTCNVQAWFVPKTAHPQFAGYDEFMYAYQGEQIKALGQADRDPPDFFHTVSSPAGQTTLNTSELYKSLGIHLPNGHRSQTDLIDAFNLIYNFRLAAHSSRLTRREYAAENLANSVKLPPAFWPSGPLHRVVPDYERALVVGELDLDVAAGLMPVKGIAIRNEGPGYTNAAGITAEQTGGSTVDIENSPRKWLNVASNTHGSDSVFFREDLDNPGFPAIFADMSGQSVQVTLADIDKARTTQAFAKLRASYAGNDHSGFDNDDAIVAELMQGFAVPEEQFNRPWLLDSKRVTFGMAERHATDSGNLDKSVTQGRASAMLSLNLPKTDTGGVIIVTVEVIPERIYERQSDEWLIAETPADLPDALRDIQRTEPVDVVFNRQVDARHTSPDGAYGFEPMNDKWNRTTTRLGGAFWQEDPANPWTEQRSALWHEAIVDPEFTENHWIVPDDFTHAVFADELADAFECVVRHDCTILGLTQIGDVLEENNDEYSSVQAAQ